MQSFSFGKRNRNIFYFKIAQDQRRLWDWSSPWSTPSFMPKSVQKCFHLRNVPESPLDSNASMQSKCPSSNLECYTSEIAWNLSVIDEYCWKTQSIWLPTSTRLPMQCTSVGFLKFVVELLVHTAFPV